MGQIVNVFSPWFYQTNINLNKKYREKVTSNLRRLYYKNKFLNAKDWNCNVHSSFGEKRLPDHFNWSPLLDAYSIKITEFINENNLNCTYFHIEDIWYNVYGKMQNQEMHTHHGSGINFSAVHFLQFDNKTDPPIRFCNTNDSFVKKRSDSEIKDLVNTGIGYYQNSYDPEIVEGSFLIFPNCLSHEVPMKFTSKLRMTISMNINIQLRSTGCDC